MEQFRVELPPTPRRTRLARRAPTSPGFPPLAATFTFIVILSYLVLIQPNPDKACPSSDEMNRCFSPTKNSRYVEAVCRNLVTDSTKALGTSTTRKGWDKKSSKIVSTGEKTILLWTTLNLIDFRFGLGRDPFIAAGCRYTNCMTTTDKSLVNQSDALIFHPNNYNHTDLPNYRFSYQRYVFLYYEVIATERDRLYIFSHPPKGYFNWTMTHRRDSDILSTHPYGSVRRRKTASIADMILPRPLRLGEDPPDPRSLFFEDILNPKIIGKKTKQVAWFNSNCVTSGGRENYFREMGQYIRIDIYGACGDMKCGPANRTNCDELLRDYKFYIAAENSICPDYITEKFYRALLSDVVPIVYGGADYSAYAPPDSYINAADFVSPKALAEYLYVLDTNPALYSKYFDWKNDWEVIRNPTNGWCDLCEKLNDPEQPPKSYKDIGNWYFDKVPCISASSVSFNKLYGEHLENVKNKKRDVNN